MTELQKLAMDALDQLGSMTMHELETACLIEPRQRGGFRLSLASLFAKQFITCDATTIHLTPRGKTALNQ